MEDCELFVGKEFPDVKTFRNAIKEISIAQHFEIRIVKSDLIRYIARCAAEGCPWRVRAVKLPNSPTFSVKSLGGTHTCGKNTLAGHHQASVDWIVNFIEERLRDNIHYKPKDILHDVYEQYGITIPYKQAWRAKERGLEAIYGSAEEGYCFLPAYCDQVRQNSPGSVAEVFTTGMDNRFQCLFVSFYASICGFLRGCLPIIGLGGIQLKSKYLGALLSAVSFDADGGLFPLAFGVVVMENDESWMWFLSELYKVLENNTSVIPQLTFLSNGQNGVTEAIRRKFPASSPSICMKHLTESIGREFKNPRLVQFLWKAAYATTSSGFREKMVELEETCPEVAKWLQEYYPSDLWALLYFHGKRYGHLSSNTDEFNQWILEARELPIIQVVECIHSKLTRIFEERLAKCEAWLSVLVPSADKRMSQAVNRACTYQVIRSDEVEFEVLSADRSDIVNIRTHSCSCLDWQLYGMPCSHAVAALIFSKKDVYTFIERYFTVASYRKAYAAGMPPIPGKLEWKDKDRETIVKDAVRIVRPPKVQRTPGRPEKKRTCIDDFSREKHTVRCSRCNQTGHYKSTCKLDVLKSLEQV